MSEPDVPVPTEEEMRRADMKAGLERVAFGSGYRCQFCEKSSSVAEWRRCKDRCPRCGRAYDYQLAQDGDDE